MVCQCTGWTRAGQPCAVHVQHDRPQEWRGGERRQYPSRQRALAPEHARMRTALPCAAAATSTRCALCERRGTHHPRAAPGNCPLPCEPSWEPPQRRPVEPFEKGSSSYSDTELPPKIPSAAVAYPFLFTDSVGDLGLAGGTPKRFGGRWDCTQTGLPNKPPRRVVKKGPHDCYCEIGFAAWSMAGKARTVNHGLKEAGLKDLWTNTPGCAHAPCRCSPLCCPPALSVLTRPPTRTAQGAGARVGLQGEQGQEA